jgi:hypothetical protein
MSTVDRPDFQNALNHNNPALRAWRTFGKEGENAERVGTTFDDTESIVQICYRWQPFSMNGDW